MNPVDSILRRATRTENDKIRVLCAPAHERVESYIARVPNVEFYAIQGEHIKTWNTTYAPIPKNYTILQGSNIPPDLSFNLILSHNGMAHMPHLIPLAKRLHLPIISVEHCQPMPNMPQVQINQLRDHMSGTINVFISKFSQNLWNFTDENSMVIPHGVDANLFKPNPRINRENRILTVANDFIGRGPILGFDIWQKCTHGLNSVAVGDTRGYSSPAKSLIDLANHYQKSLIYFNPSRYSPIPMSLLEAMACGCCIVSTATAMIPEIIQDGVNGFISNDEDVLRKRLQHLMNNPDQAKLMGEKARQTILDKFPLPAFVENWKNIFEKASKLVYKG